MVGRPRRVPVETQENTETPAETGAKKRRKRGVVNGQRLKLDAPQRPGYVRRWVNDDKNRIAELEELAYDFVHEAGISTDTGSSRVARRVGTKADGSPLLSYLMETPIEEYRIGVAEKEETNAQVDEAIRAGRAFETQLENQYGEGSIKTSRS